VVDQLDEVFAAKVSAEGQAAFARILEALLATGSVWIIASLRAESFDAYLRSALASLLLAQPTRDAPPQAAGTPTSGPAVAVERNFNLLPPNIAEIGEIVRAPAAVCKSAGIALNLRPIPPGASIPMGPLLYSGGF
jgi:hypothetical protein